MSTRELIQETCDNIEVWLDAFSDELPPDMIEGMEITLDKLERQLEV